MTTDRNTTLTWLLSILTLLMLATSMPIVRQGQVLLWLLFVGLIALVLNYRVVFREGEISPAHAVTLMAYFVLAEENQPGPALWAVAIGAALGHSIVQLRAERWQGLAAFLKEPIGAVLRGTGQQVLGVVVANVVYLLMGGSLPLDHFIRSDVFPVGGAIASFLAVYLTIRLLDTSGRSRNLNAHIVTQNWRILAAVLLLPLPITIMTPLLLARGSILASSLLLSGMLMIIFAIDSLSTAHQRYQQQVYELSLLSRVSHALRPHLNLQPLLQTLYQEVSRLFPVSTFTVALYDAGRQVVDFPLHIVQHQAQPLETRPIAPHLLDHVIVMQAPLLITENVRHYAVDLKLQAPEGILYSWLGVPLIAVDRALGCIVIGSSKPDQVYSEIDQHLMTEIAARASVAIENALLYERTRKHEAQLKALTIAAGELGRTLAPLQVTDNICQAAPAVAGAQAAAVFLFWDEKNLAFNSATGFPNNYFEKAPIMPLLVENFPGIPIEVSSLAVSDVQTDARAERFRSAFMQHNIRAFAELVLRSPEDKRLFGIVVVYYTRPTHIDSGLIDVLENFALQASMSISNATLYNEANTALSQQMIQLSMLAEAGRELTSTQEEQQLYHLTLTRALQGTDASLGVILIAADVNQLLTAPRLFTRAGARQVELAGILPTLQQLRPALEQVYQSKKLLTFTRESVQRSTFYRLHSDSTSQAIIPLFEGASVVGVMLLEHSLQKNFTQQDTVFIMQLVSQSSITIENIQLVNSLAEGRDRLQAILDSMTEGVILINRRGYILLANPSVQTLLHLEPHDLLQKHINELLDEPPMGLARAMGFQPDELRRELKLVQAGTWSPADSKGKDYELGHPVNRFIQRTDAPVRGEDGRLMGLLMVFKDITEEQELKRTQEELSNMIVHDLRGPLTAVTASFRILQEVANPEDQFGKVVLQTTDISGRAVRKLLNLVNSLLDISKMEAGMVTLDQEPSSLQALVQQVIEELQPLASEMEVQLINAISGDAPMVNVDADKMERVFYNLVDNAIKFTPGNGHVAVHMGQPATNDGYLRVEVRDTGPGIPDQYKHTLFNRYEQVQGRQGRRHGTGLGLTFCKLTIEAHGGQIWVEDNPGGGSVFAFTLPLTQEPYTFLKE